MSSPTIFFSAPRWRAISLLTLLLATFFTNSIGTDPTALASQPKTQSNKAHLVNRTAPYSLTPDWSAAFARACPPGSPADCQVQLGADALPGPSFKQVGPTQVEYVLPVEHRASLVGHADPFAASSAPVSLGDHAPTIVCNPTSGYACVEKAGTILANETWLSTTVYVANGLTIAPGVTVTVEAGTIIKMYVPPGALNPDPLQRGTLTVNGAFDFLGTPSNPVVVTSYRDDTYGGDNNGDGVCPLCSAEPSAGDYTMVFILNGGDTDLPNAIVRYGYFGFLYFTVDTDIAPLVDNVTFENNVYGLRLQTAGAGDITALIQNSRFTQNQYGIVTYGGATTGVIQPTLTNNSFTVQPVSTADSFPIYLDGAGYPIYGVGNVFDSTPQKRLSIAVGGYYAASGTWPQVLDDNGNPMPYVVYGDKLSNPAAACPSGNIDGLLVASGVTLTVPANTIFKFYVSPACPRAFDIRGTLDMQSTSNANRVIFTSYRDDTYGGDNNGDGGSTSPLPGDWYAVSLFSSLNVFDWTRVKYAYLGVRVYNENLFSINPQVNDNILERDGYGMFLLPKSAGDITSLIQNNLFDTNTYGLGTSVYSEGGAYFGGGSRPILTSNQFNNHSDFPIYLGGTAFPVYTGNTNTFSGNAHPAIALGGFFMADGTWASVMGAPDVNANLPYVIYQFTGVGPTACSSGGPPGPCTFVNKVTVPASTVFKFYIDGDAPDIANDGGLRALMIDVYGALDMLSTSAANQVVFTSYRDDLVDDTSGNALAPAKSDWDSVALRGNQILIDEGGATVHFDYGLVKYSANGVQIQSLAVASNNIFPYVDHNTLQSNRYGMYLFTTAAGDINSPIADNLFTDNDYGLVIVNASTGAAFPSLTNNVFQNHTQFPIFFGGSAFPVYNAGNTFINNSHLAIGLAGIFYRSGILNPLTVTVGNPATYMPYVVSGADWTVAAGAAVSVPPGTIVKLDTNPCPSNPGCSIVVNGELDLQGTSSNPVVFTSYKDDSSGGDTNGDGGATTPSRTDWWGLYLYSNGINANYAFDYATIKYAEYGLIVLSSGASNIFPRVENSTFVENGFGLFFYAGGSGNVTSLVSNNVFANNNVHVYGDKAPVTGQLYPTLVNNDLIGTTSNMGINLLAVGATITATQNWWGHSTGPRHATLNAAGQGVVISNVVGSTVLFNPWDSAPNSSGVTYSILGRVAKEGDTPQTPDPLAGAYVLLGSGAYTFTNANGNYAFAGLPLGTAYSVRPLLSGYTFTPISRTGTLQGDATGQNFVASPIVGTLYAVSGRVLNITSQPFPGVLVYTLSSSNGASAGALTDTGGYYTFTVPAGDYTVQAVKTGYNFTPFIRNVQVINGPVGGQNFQEAAITLNKLFLPLVRR